MKIRRCIIWLPMVLVVVVMLVSCGYKNPGYTYPTVPASTALVPAIATTTVGVTGKAGETLVVEFDPKTGKCSNLVVNGERIGTCEDPNDKFDFIHKREETFYCVPPSAEHPANAKINDVEVYCGNVKFLTDGADIQFIAESADGNKKCKNVGGFVI
ncbi:MAG: hypothetical protein PVG52_13825 [Desulfobacterales bacterium]